MDVAARLEAVEIENDLLRERIAQLETLLGMRTTVPLEFGLTGQETRAFGCLMARDVCSKEVIMAALYGDRWGAEDVEPKIVDVFICKSRKKLKPFGIEIKTAWGRGYYLEPDVKVRVRAMLPTEDKAA